MLSEYSDKYFDLAIIDPQYGIGWTTTIKQDTEKKIKAQKKARYKKHEDKDWDKEPMSKEFFIEIQRVSKNQIIFGANYFIDRLPNPNTKCWIYWHKMNTKFTAVTDEQAWTSFDKKPLPIFLDGNTEKGFLNKYGSNMHPTQKPIALYEIILKHFAKQGDKILDTHLGSGSSRIAAHKLGFDFYGFEIDDVYFENSDKRFQLYLQEQAILSKQHALFKCE